MSMLEGFRRLAKEKEKQRDIERNRKINEGFIRVSKGTTKQVERSSKVVSGVADKYIKSIITSKPSRVGRIPYDYRDWRYQTIRQKRRYFRGRL